MSDAVVAPAVEAALKERFGAEIHVPQDLPGIAALRTIVEHSSHRRWTPASVDPDVLRLLFACALSAPSKSDLQQADIVHVADRERALIAGHADIRFTGLLTVTAPTREELEGAVAEVSRAAIQCGCETRRLCGQQGRAFTAAALPLARKLH